MNLGASEIFLIVIVILLLFGGKRLPELARSLGKGLSEFRRAAQSVQREVSQSVEDPPPNHRPRNQDPPPILNAPPASQPRTPSTESRDNS